jgi:MSHA biogenesis protein MshQ
MRWLISFVLILCPAVASAQIGFGAKGAASGGTTSVSLAYPAGIAAGDLLVVCLANKYPANGPETTPSGFVIPTNGQGSGGQGASGVDAGNVYATVFVKVADGSEAGNLSIAIASGNSAVGVIARYTKTLASWSYAATNGAMNTASTSWSVTGAADPGVVGGDLVVACTAVNGNAVLFTGASHVMAQAGVTYAAGTEREEGTSATGDDTALVLADMAASSGTSSGVPTYTATTSVGGADTPAGATVILRLRETAAAGGCTGGLLLLGAGKCE